MKLFVSICLALIFAFASIICTVIVGQNIYSGEIKNTITYVGTFCALFMVICIGIIILFAFSIERRRAKTKKTWKFPWISLYAILVFTAQQFCQHFFPKSNKGVIHIAACNSQWCCPSQYTIAIGNAARYLFLFCYCLVALFTVWILYLKFLRKPKIQAMSEKEQKEIG